MFKSDGYRAQKAEFAEMATATTDPDELRSRQERERSLTELANNEQWVADNHDNILHASENPDGGVLTAGEAHILQCLGAAVIMQWNLLPTALQKDLFDDAGTVGDMKDTEALRGLIARFLHKHKNHAERVFTGDRPRPGMGARS